MISHGIIRHIFRTPFGGYLVGWHDDNGHCHEEYCASKDDLVKCLENVLGFSNFEEI